MEFPLEFYQSLVNEVHELYFGDLDQLVTNVERIPFSSFNVLSFYREFVSQNKPCIITGAVDHWPAVRNWKDMNYLADRLNDVEVSVDVTPNGRADSIDDSFNYFVLPEERRMKFRDFLQHFRKSANEVLYIQHQNSSFTT